MAKRELFLVSSIRAGGVARAGTIILKKTRTLTITCKCTYHASATAGAKVNVYFSPDEENWDTIPYTYFFVDFTAGATVQKTVIVDPPEDGSLAFEIENTDTSYAVTDVNLWITIQEWEEK